MKYHFLLKHLRNCSNSMVATPAKTSAAVTRKPPEMNSRENLKE